jgi:hypothetical protein
MVFSRFFIVWLSHKMLHSRVLAGHHHLPHSLASHKGDSNGFFSTLRVCMVSHRSVKMSGSSLIVAYWQISFLAISAGYLEAVDTALLSLSS